MVIEVTKRYIIGKHTLDSILEDYCMYDHDETENFSDWLLDRIENEYYDESLISGDVESVRKLCELSETLENEKNRLLEI